jgi:PhzF family phenazine biosynthesis protein
MKTYHLKVVDAFTTSPFKGNPAGVVLDANGLSDSQMQYIAREMNLSETAFILPASETGANLQIRWFSPISEVPLCGHATIASFHALAEECMEGMKANGQHYFRLQTQRGILSVRVEKNFYRNAIEFELPVPKFKIKKKLPLKLFNALNLNQKDLQHDIPVVMDSYLYIPLKNISMLEKLSPEYLSLSKEMDTLKVNGVCLFTLKTKENQSSVHSRFFAPNYGINEDPVTGSANGPLGCYLFQYAIPAGYSIVHRELSDGRIEFVGEQGDAIDRAGRVKIRLRILQNNIEDLFIVGEAVTIFTATMKL